MTAFHAYLLHELQHGSYTYLESYQVEAPDERPVERLEQSALERVKSRWEFPRMELLGVARLEIYQVRWPCGSQITQDLILRFAVLETTPGGVFRREGDSGGWRR